MKYSYLLFAAIANLAVAQQKLTDVIPKCSVDCLTKAVKDGTNCSSIDDSTCICEATNYRNIYTVGVPCVLQSCSSDVATGQLLPAAAKFCHDVTGGASAPPVESASASATASLSVASASVSVSVTVAPTASASGSAASGAAATATTAQPAAAAAVGSMGAFGMLALGALAVF
ncbi:CFEM domain-containing protein [Colletotrichum graminicola M1.001]|uniref:CFEM domain-containing protein n=1 Tax=Colletotrichum graminicola (strain M1.001 / M2 / FGSC 10212) TaxID=645133 RepID=E3QT31_COLGM|nr:CFEM domain-containing protein [Colletotrichum graminicola M1.001]EFQ34019.1 CFEM domain-containing protein [Colletotrichum graminicola M1.001]